ncbi:MAG: hypothetical protein IJ922_06035 [Leuconostoc sp.]|nr:hypothetical protein [Leuconostoc sp.]
MAKKDYVQSAEAQDVVMASEPAIAVANTVDVAIPSGIAHAQIKDGVLQVTADIEEEIAEVDHGDVVTMNEFKTQFAKWLD